jgi:hypothetical protein
MFVVSPPSAVWLGYYCTRRPENPNVGGNKGARGDFAALYRTARASDRDHPKSPAATGDRALNNFFREFEAIDLGQAVCGDAQGNSQVKWEPPEVASGLGIPGLAVKVNDGNQGEAIIFRISILPMVPHQIRDQLPLMFKGNEQSVKDVPCRSRRDERMISVGRGF